MTFEPKSIDVFLPAFVGVLKTKHSNHTLRILYDFNHDEYRVWIEDKKTIVTGFLVINTLLKYLKETFNFELKGKKEIPNIIEEFNFSNPNYKLTRKYDYIQI